MNSNYEYFRDKAFSALHGLARECPEFEDAEMLVGSSEAEATLFKQNVFKKIDTEWIDAIERAIPALDTIIRHPSVAIEDVDEILPVELSKHITEKSIKHLAQHTNLILNVDGDEVTPQKILNVYHDETYLTYENKFVNTLLARLSAFVDKRFAALADGSGTERNYEFNYKTEFEHHLEGGGGRNSARIHLRIELTSPLDAEASESNIDVNESYALAVERIRRINMAILSYRASAFATKMGRNYIRPPVIRTNAILKNKNLRECLTLWEFIESFDKVGYSMTLDEIAEMPSSSYISDLYSSVALQYLNFYNGVAENEGNRLLSQKHLFETAPEFDTEHHEDELDDYMVYDSEYRKTVPVSRLMNNRKKLSEDEKRIHLAIKVALRADEIINEELLRAEEEARRLARQKRLEEEEARRRAEEEEARRRAEEAARIAAEEEALRLAQEAERARAKLLEIRLRRSFMARLIQSEDDVQGYYSEIKNLLLSYKGVKSRISWKSESFKKGRVHMAKADVKGKKLYLYLALDPAEFKDSKYFFTDLSEKSNEYPMLIKVKSNRGLKYAIELIEILAEKLGLVRFDRVSEDYRMPYETDKQLLDRGLIKLIKPDAVLDDTRPEPPAPDVEESTELILSAPDGISEIRLHRSFTARLIQADESIQNYYNEIKNHLLSYKGVKSRISWKAESYKKGRIHVARADIKGKKLYLYLALDPTEFEESKYFFNDVSAKNKELPLLMKVRSDRGLKHAIELIEILAGKLGLVRFDRVPEDYRMPYESDAELLKRELIKLVKVDTVLEDAKPQELAEEQASAVEVPSEEPVTEQALEANESEEPVVMESAELILSAPDGISEIRLHRSFTARLIQADESIQNYYNEIKNHLLSYKGVKSRISWKAESYKKGRIHVARADIKGKKLYLYLALDPTEFEESKYFFNDVSAKNKELPLLMKVRSDRGLKHAIELIEILAGKLGLLRFDRVSEDYRMPYESDAELLKRELIKVVNPINISNTAAQEVIENTAVEEADSNAGYISEEEKAPKTDVENDVPYTEHELSELSEKEKNDALLLMKKLEEYKISLLKISELKMQTALTRKNARRLKKLSKRTDALKKALSENERFNNIVKRLER